MEDPKMRGKFNFVLTEEEQKALEEDIDTDNYQKAVSSFVKRFTVMKGDKGDSPTKKDLIDLILPLVPKPIKGDKGDKGDKPEKEDLLTIILPLIPKVKDGKTPTKEELIDLITRLIPNPKHGKDGSPDTPQEIKIKLETLKGDDRLDASAIKNLPKGGGGDGGRFGLGSVGKVDLSSQCNGSNKTFNVPAHSFGLSLRSSTFPHEYREIVDWTSSGYTLTLTDNVTAPQQGITLSFTFVR